MPSAPTTNWATAAFSKLWIARLKNKETVFNWDRGMDQAAASAKTQAVVNFLAAGLAEHVYHN